MLSKNTQWILCATAMVVFLCLAWSGHTTLLGLAITAVALVWYSVVPVAGPKDNRYKR